MVAVRSSPILFATADREVIHETWRRRMLLEGTWRALLAEHVQRQLGPLRARLVGDADTSSNLFASVVDQTCTMYDEEPAQAHQDAASLVVLRDSFKRGGWWAKARQHQKYVRGLLKSLVYVGWDTEGGHATFDLVTPDVVEIEWAASNKARPVTIWWARQRPVPGKVDEDAVFWDRWSIDPKTGPSFTIWSNDRKRDMTVAHGVNPAEWRGDAYAWRDELGRPLLPFVIYWALGPGVECPGLHSSVTFGTLQVGLLWTAAVHGMLRASWDQRVLANGKIKGGTVAAPGESGAGTGTASVRMVTGDPTSIMQVDGENVSWGSWGSPLDIEKAERFCRMYEARLAVHFGLSPADLVIESLNPASGASITVSQAGKRRIALRDRVNLADGDTQLAELVAAVNRGSGRACTATGYRLRYHGVALTIDERIKVLQYVEKELELGLADEVTAYQELHPGTSTEDAAADLEVLAERRRMAERRAAVMEELNAPAEPLANTGQNGNEDDDAEDDDAEGDTEAA